MFDILKALLFFPDEREQKKITVEDLLNEGKKDAVQRRIENRDYRYFENLLKEQNTYDSTSGEDIEDLKKELSELKLKLEQLEK